ncbi:hypothetical protein A6A08_03420 [Nocardiopsis sp. TSRI0078]|uniref:hypothetical protein n=1 Tax=unclassified Nocardiopsis TaxID=2649073 RepID=UPI000960CE78|nr:hypothetical protein [Nocardiopsis sp. TSRI0078]OKI23822.1 hypothetical protein A6A08_03420 [Nocardiopsis sp. TSRI0078]
MSGVHGLTNASGVRSAVLTTPVRRALLLTALAFGALVSAWLTTSAPVLAQEKPTPNASAQGAQAPAQQAGPAAEGRGASTGRVLTGQADATARPDTDQGSAAHAGTGRPDAARTTAASAARTPEVRTGSAATNAPVHTNTSAHTDGKGRAPAAHAAPGRLDKPVTGAVADVGRKTSRILFDASDAVAPGLGAGGNGVAQQVRDNVHGMPDFVEERLAANGVPGTAPAAVEPSDEGTDRDEDARTREDGAVLTGSGHAVDAAVTASGPSPDTTAQHPAERSAEDAPAPFGGEAITSSAPNTATGSAPGGATGGGVAGYLPATGALAPAHGLVQAAWHVLRSVPAESADEPTFSPD